MGQMNELRTSMQPPSQQQQQQQDPWPTQTQTQSKPKQKGGTFPDFL